MGTEIEGIMGKIDSLEGLWEAMFIEEWIRRRVGPTALYEKLNEGEHDAYLEEAFREGRISREEWDSINSEAEIEGFEEAVKIMCDIYCRLGLLTPMAGREGGEA